MHEESDGIVSEESGDKTLEANVACTSKVSSIRVRDRVS